MPKPISMDLRARLVETYNRGGHRYDDVAERFQVGRATVYRVLARKKKTGDIAPTVQKHGPDPSIDDQGLEIIRGIVEAKPDVTQSEIVDAYLEITGKVTSTSTVSRALKRLGLTRKKRLSSLRSATTRGSSGSATASSHGAKPSTRHGASSSTRQARTSR